MLFFFSILIIKKEKEKKQLWQSIDLWGGAL